MAANPAWTALAQPYATQHAAPVTLGFLFPDAASAPMDVVCGAALVTRHATYLADGLNGTASWWDLDFVSHAEDPDVVLVTARDATDRVLAHRAADDARLRLAQNAVGIGSGENGAATQCQAWSPSQFRLYGLDPPTAIPPSFEDWLEVADPQDQLADDITDQQQIEHDLRSSEAGVRALADAIPHLIYTATPDGISDYKNKRWFDYSGQSPEQARAEGWLEALHPDDYDETVAVWSQSIRTGQPYEHEHRLRGKDGRYRWFLSRAVPLRQPPAGPIIRWIGTSTDISEIVEARQLAAHWSATLETQVAERTRALTEAAVALQAEMRRRQDIQSALLQSQKLEALGQLTAGVAHDFNNVLSVILNSFEKIGRHTNEPKLLAAASAGESATERAISLTRQLLDFGRSESLIPSVVDIETAIRQADALISHAITGAITRSIEVQPGVWPVLTDGHQLEIALLNLAVNARDAMPDGGTLAIVIHNLALDARPDSLPFGDYVCISVQDTGHGMPPDVAARAAEPFFTTKAKGKGTGLGLPMVCAFARRSGGCLRIESREGVGTTVQIILPRAAVSGMERGGATAQQFAAPADHRARTILLVEDDDPVRQITVSYLRELGYSVIEASNAEEAIVLSHSMDYLDLLVTDVRMPGADGRELARRVRAERPGVPVLFITGQPGRDDLAGEHVLPKPFTGTNLIRAIGRRIKAAQWDTQGGDTADGGLVHRLRNPALLAGYLFWRAARHGDRPPRLPDLDWGGLPDAEHAFTVAVERAESTVSFRFLKVGRALGARLDRTLEGTSIATDILGDPKDEVVGSLTGAYRRCVRTLSPSYEYASFDLGDGEPTAFERLVLPVCDDGEHVTHLVGLALFSGAT